MMDPSSCSFKRDAYSLFREADNITRQKMQNPAKLDAMCLTGFSGVALTHLDR